MLCTIRNMKVMTVRMHLSKNITLNDFKYVPYSLYFLSNWNVHIIPKFSGSPEMKFDPKKKFQIKNLKNLVKSSLVTRNLFILFQGYDAAYLNNIKKEFLVHFSNYCNFFLKFTGNPELKTERSSQILAVH